MKRTVKLVQEDEASDRVRAVYDDVLRTTGKARVPNLFKVMAAISEEQLEINWMKYKHTAFVECCLPGMLTQLVLFVVSIKGGNRYCITAHAYTALYMDEQLTYADLIDLAEGGAHERLPASYQAAIRFAGRATESPVSLEDPEYDFLDELQSAGFSQEEIDELMAQIDVGVMLNVFCAINEIPIENPEFWLSYAPTPERTVTC